MRVVVAREALLEALGKARRAVARRSGLTAVQYVLLDADAEQQMLRATGTDLEVVVQAETPVEVATSWSALAPLEFADWLKMVRGDEVTLMPRDAGGVQARVGESEGVFAAPSTEDYPPVDLAMPQETMHLTGYEVRKLLRAVGVAVTKGDGAVARPVLGTVYLHEHEGKLAAAGSDGYRLALWEMDKSAPEGLSVLLPEPVLKLVAWLGEDVEFGLNERKQVVMQVGEHVRVGAQTVEGRYPAFRQVIPTGGRLIVLVDRDALAQALRQVEVFAYADPGQPKQLGMGVRLTIEPERMTVRLESEVGYGSVTLPVKARGLDTGERFEIAANVRMLREGVEAWDGTALEMRLLDPRGPMVLWGIQGYCYVQMPMLLE